MKEMRKKRGGRREKIGLGAERNELQASFVFNWNCLLLFLFSSIF